MTREQIEGRRPVIEALRAGREISEIFVLRTARRIDEIRRLASRRGIPIRDVRSEKIDDLAQTRAPQGVIAFATAFRYSSLAWMLERAGEPALLVALDQITDPQNVGAIARSAEAAGAHGLVIPARRSASVSAAAEKASAGALEHLPVAQVPNLPRALAQLKHKGLWVVALDASGEAAIYDLPVASDPMCLVVGSESRGVSRLVRERADHVVRIPMSGRIESLNASAAAAVALFEIRRQRG